MKTHTKSKNKFDLAKKSIAAIAIAAFLLSLAPVPFTYATQNLRPELSRGIAGAIGTEVRATAKATGGWTEETAVELVAGWSGLTPGQRQRKLTLLNERTTPDAVRSNIQVRRQPPPPVIPAGEKVVSVALPDSNKDIIDLSVDADPAERAVFIAEGATKETLNRLGIVIAAGGEGTRLMIKLWQEGKITNAEKEALTKFTMPFAPDGIGTLQQDLLVLSFISKKFGVDMPVLVVANMETEDRLKMLLRNNNLFGLNNVAVVGQDMEATLISGEDKIAVDTDGNVVFNPNGGGGVMKAVSKNIIVLKNDGTEQVQSGFDWFENCFRRAGVEDGRVVSLNSDMEVMPEQIFGLAQAAQDHDVVAVSYRYPTDDLDAGGNHTRNKYGAFIRVETEDAQGERHSRLISVEYADWGQDIYLGLADLIKSIEQTGSFIQGNAGLYAFSLRFLKQTLAKLPKHVQRKKDSMGVDGKVDKIEYFVPDLPGYGANAVVVTMDEPSLRPVKDWDRLTSKRAERVEQAKAQLADLGIVIEGNPVVQLSVEFAYALRQGLVSMQQGAVATIKGSIGVKFTDKAIEIYTLRERLPDEGTKEGDNFLVFDRMVNKIPYNNVSGTAEDVLVLPSIVINEKAFQKRVLVLDSDINSALITKKYISEEIGFGWSNIFVRVQRESLTDAQIEHLKNKVYDADLVLVRDVDGTYKIIAAGLENLPPLAKDARESGVLKEALTESL